jgi:C4-type Zn-finger protein
MIKMSQHLKAKGITMSALCEKCKYEFTAIGLAGHISSELYTPQMSKIKQTKGVMQNEASQFMATFMSNQEIPCPRCKQYIAWIPNNN